MAIFISFTIANFPPQLHTDIYLSDFEQTAQIAVPIWLIILLFEIYGTYTEETYCDLLLDIGSSCASVCVNTVGIYSLFILILFSPTKMISILMAVIILLTLVAFSVVSYRNRAEDEKLITVFKAGIHKTFNAVFYISIIICIILLLAVNNIIPYEIKGNPSTDSKNIAETIAFDDDYFSLSQEERFQLYADFISSEAKRLGIDSNSVKVKPAISRDQLTSAFYLPESRTIYINVNVPMLYYGGNFLVTTLLHELFHAYEHDIISGRINPSNLDYGLSEHANQWRLDSENYVSVTESIEKYLSQTLEIDAYDFAQRRSSELVNLEEYTETHA